MEMTELLVNDANGHLLNSYSVSACQYSKSLTKINHLSLTTPSELGEKYLDFSPLQKRSPNTNFK